jgi:hypothetical protein
MLTFEDFKQQWLPREDYLRRGLGTERTGTAFWKMAYRQYVRLESYATVNMVGFPTRTTSSH